MAPEEAFDQYHQAVYSFAYRLTRNPDAAEDVTQECFLALVRAPERYDTSRGSLKTYLFAMARNLALKHYRDNPAEEPLDDFAPAAADDLEDAVLSSAVAAAVAALPLLQREASVLFEYEGATLEEIARVVEAEVGTVKSRLHRARERLRRSLAPYRKDVNSYGTVRER